MTSREGKKIIKVRQKKLEFHEYGCRKQRIKKLEKKFRIKN